MSECVGSWDVTPDDPCGREGFTGHACEYEWNDPNHPPLCECVCGETAAFARLVAVPAPAVPTDETSAPPAHTVAMDAYDPMLTTRQNMTRAIEADRRGRKP